MKKRLIWLFLYFNINIFSSFSQSPFSKETDILIFKGMDYTFTCKFDSALVQYKKVELVLPDEIAGYFYQAAVLQSMMMDYETDKWSDEFYFNIEKAIHIGEDKIKKEKPNAWDLFYLGNSYSYKGLYQAKSGSLVSGFMNAHRGVQYLEKALTADSTLYDALIGLGSYKYWAGRFYRYLRWLPFIGDEREMGIRMVLKGIEKGTFSCCAGLNSLGWIEYDRKKYESALDLFRKGLERYPESRFFLWGVADCLYKMNRFPEAIRVYEDLLDSVKKSAGHNGYNEVECRIKLAESYFSSGYYDQSLRHCEAVLELKTDQKTNQRIGKKRQTAQGLKKKCIKIKEKETQ